jgi:uncharacterized membrane protein YkoI
MQLRSAQILMGASSVLVLAWATTASAEQAANDAIKAAKANITLAEAVAIAEQKTGGRASKAEFEQAAEGWVFDVETVAGEKVSDVHVNADTGAVMSVADDAIDNDDVEEGERGESD